MFIYNKSVQTTHKMTKLKTLQNVTTKCPFFKHLQTVHKALVPFDQLVICKMNHSPFFNQKQT